jgi:hypothetical protein
MSFTFSRKSNTEAEKVRNIIQTFRQHAYQELLQVLEVSFLLHLHNLMFHIGLGDNENRFINRLKRSVLQSVTVGYST